MRKNLYLRLMLVGLLAALLIIGFSAFAGTNSITLAPGEYCDFSDYTYGYTIDYIYSSNPSVAYVSGNGIIGSTAGYTNVDVSFSGYEVDDYGNIYPYSDETTFYVTVSSPTPQPQPDVSRSVTVNSGNNEFVGDFLTISNIYSSNSSVASAYQSGANLIVCGNGAGSCVITASVTTVLGQYSPQTLTVYVTVRSNSTNYSENISMLTGQTGMVEQYYTRVNNLSSSNRNVASAFFDGSRINVTGVSSGSATITATAMNSAGTTVNVVLYVSVSEPSSQSRAIYVTLKAGQSKDITDLGNYSLSNIYSSNNNVASVSYTGGRLTVYGQGAGTATISCDGKGIYSNDRVKASITVTVTAASSGSGSSGGGSSSEKSRMTFSVKQPVKTKIGKSYKINTVKVDGSKVSNTSLVWSVSDDSILKVGKDGKFKCLDSGTAYIIVNTKDGEVTGRVKIVVS